MPAALSALLGAALRGAVPGDEVTALPGWSGPLPSRMWSGYLPVGNKSGVPGQIHYWFIESEGDPKSDPVVYWTNGGPGGSGISTGLLNELGQLQLNEVSLTNATGGVPALQYNPFSWSRVASTVFVSQPKGVGFSHCDDAASPADCANNDITAAEDAYEFFLAFFGAYPEFQRNDFYLTSESYGGIYLPMFADQIDRRGGVPNFKGFAVGDGCWGGDVGMCALGREGRDGKAKQIRAEFHQGHSMLSQPLYQKLNAACGGWTNDGVGSDECKALLNQSDEEIGSFNIYNVYDTCGDDGAAAPAAGRSTLRAVEAAMAARAVVVESDAPPAVPHLSGAVNDYLCTTDASARWLQLPEVAAALHVTPNTTGMNYSWGPADVSGDLRPLYKRLAQKYRVMIYSGDTDGCVPTWGTEEWVRELGFPVRRPWRQWVSRHLGRGRAQRAGYVIDYDLTNTSGQLRLVTVQGAGHMVPLYKPGFALTMITKFLRNEEF